MSRSTVAYAGLALAAFLFGATFVVIKEALESMPPLGFVGWRFLFGAAVLFVLAVPRRALVWRDGLVAGLFLYAGYALQTAGLARTSASNSGLITGLYVVFTPFLAAAYARRRVSGRVVTGGALAFAGLALLTLRADFALQSGDLLTVGCAVAFAAHIVLLARLAPRHPVIPMTAVQLLTTAVLALAASAAFEDFPVPDREVIGALLLTGVLVSAGAFLLQVYAQTIVGPSQTAIVLALEPAFAAATAAVVLNERLTARGWVGAVLILAGIFVVLAVSRREDERLQAAEAITPAH